MSQPHRGAGRAAVYVRLSLFYATFLGMGGITLPFWPTWLQAKGLDAGAIGLLLSVPMWVRIASTPLLARLADRRAAAKPILVLALIAALACYGVFAVSNGFWALLAVTFFANGLYGSILPLGESISLSACRDHRLDYGRVRLWGSISFILVAAAAGQFLAGRSPDWILWLTLIGFALAIAAALALPGRRAAPPPSGAGLRFMRKAMGVRGVEFADLLGVTPETVSRWEADKHPIDRGAFTLLGMMVADRIAGTHTTEDALRATRAPRRLGDHVEVKLAS